MDNIPDEGEDEAQSEQVGIERVFHQFVRARLRKGSSLDLRPGSPLVRGSTFESSHPFLPKAEEDKTVFGEDPVNTLISGAPPEPYAQRGRAAVAQVTAYRSDDELLENRQKRSATATICGLAAYSVFFSSLLLVGFLLAADFVETRQGKNVKSAVRPAAPASAPLAMLQTPPARERAPEIKAPQLKPAPQEPRVVKKFSGDLAGISKNFDRRYETGPGSRPALAGMALSCDLRGARRLLNAGAKIDEPDSQGETPLSWAVKHNCLSVAKLLIERGANVDHVADNGFTPRHWARWFHHFKLQELMHQISPSA